MTPVGRKALLLGSGELGKEVAIELQRYGVEVVACDRYANAPAMQIAHRSYVFNMLDGAKLREVVELEKPDHIIPEVEAIATPTLFELEAEGYNVTPTARAAWHQRDWIFYATSTHIFGKKINKALADFPQLPISIYAENDPEWQEYDEMSEAEIQ